MAGSEMSLITVLPARPLPFPISYPLGSTSLLVVSVENRLLMGSVTFSVIGLSEC